MNAARRRAAALAAATLLAGCAAVGPEYSPPKLDFVEAAADRATDAHSSATPLERWWESFGDAQLADLIERALFASPQLEVAQARVEQARAALGVSRSARLPQLDAGASFNRFRRSTQNQGGAPFFGQRDISSWDAGFDARWELDLFGGLERDVEAALADAQGLEEARRAARVSLAAEVARNYLELRVLQQRLATARERIQAYDETAQIVVLRAEAGVASDLDSTRARAQVASARADAPTLEAQSALRIHRLGVLLGAAPTALEGELRSVRGVPIARLGLLVEQPLAVLARRPDVRQAERACAAASARVGVAVAQRYPRISLGAGFGWLANETDDLFKSSAVAASVLPSISLPLFDGGARRAQVEGASAREQEALANHRQVVLSALEEVENAFVALGAASQRRAALRESLEQQRQAAQYARELYVGGVENFLTVLDAERERFALEDRYLESEGEVALQFVALAKALGGGWSDERDAVLAAR